MVRGRLERAFASVQPPPRLVDWSLLVCVSFEAGTGLLSFTVGTPDRWYVRWHGPCASSGTATTGWSHHALPVPTRSTRTRKLPPWTRHSRDSQREETPA